MLLQVKVSDTVLMKHTQVDSSIDIIYLFLLSLTLLKIITLQLWL